MKCEGWLYLGGEVEEDGPAVGEEVEIFAGLVEGVHQHAQDAEDDQADG